MNYETFFQELMRALKKLPKDGKYYRLKTLAERKKNLIKIEGDCIYVATEKEIFRVFKEIDKYYIKRTFKLLMDGKWLKQITLKKEKNVKRTSFILAAFNLLDYFEYDSEMNAIRMKKRR